MHGPRRRHLPDRLPHRPGRRRRVPAGQRGGDHHRRLPGPPARDGAGHQQHRRGQRHVHRARARRHPRPDRLAPGLPHLRAGRALRHRVGLPGPARAEHPSARAHRLGRQPHLRARAHPHHGRRHLRHPPRRRPPGRLGQPARPGPAGRRRGQPRRLRDRRAPRGRPDVPPAALPHPRLHLRDALDVPLRGRARRPDVHAHHLAAGHLAAPARLRLHRDAAVGGHLHAAADGRDAGRGTDLGLPVRPLRRAPVRHRRAWSSPRSASAC